MVANSQKQGSVASYSVCSSSGLIDCNLGFDVGFFSPLRGLAISYIFFGAIQRGQHDFGFPAQLLASQCQIGSLLVHRIGSRLIMQSTGASEPAS